jgi:hypothetical protein
VRYDDEASLEDIPLIFAGDSFINARKGLGEKLIPLLLNTGGEGLIWDIIQGKDLLQLQPNGDGTADIMPTGNGMAIVRIRLPKKKAAARASRSIMAFSADEEEYDELYFYIFIGNNGAVDPAKPCYLTTADNVVLMNKGEMREVSMSLRLVL